VTVDLRSQPYWSEADQSELDVLVFELVKAVHAHREGCSICRTGGPWCVPLVDGLEAVLDWREGRVLRSKAAWLRARQTLAEERAAA
jgi:hypothetical protein